MNPTKKCTICEEEFYVNYNGKYYCAKHLEMKLYEIKKEGNKNNSKKNKLL